MNGSSKPLNAARWPLRYYERQLLIYCRLVVLKSRYFWCAFAKKRYTGAQRGVGAQRGDRRSFTNVYEQKWDNNKKLILNPVMELDHYCISITDFFFSVAVAELLHLIGFVSLVHSGWNILRVALIHQGVEKGQGVTPRH